MQQQHAQHSGTTSPHLRTVRPPSVTIGVPNDSASTLMEKLEYGVVSSSTSDAMSICA